MLILILLNMSTYLTIFKYTYSFADTVCNGEKIMDFSF